MCQTVMRITVGLTIALVGCAAPRQMYEGQRRPFKQVAIVDLNEDSGARVTAVDSIRATNGETDDEHPHFTGKLALLPGRHTLEVYYKLTRYSEGSESYDATQRVSSYVTPRGTTFYSTNTKRITFDVQAGQTYRIEAECQPLEFPWGAMTWRAWIVEEKTGALVAAATAF